ncbi:hypothetical protein [Nocardioides convexus]
MTLHPRGEVEQGGVVEQQPATGDQTHGPATPRRRSRPRTSRGRGRAG